MLSGAVLSEVLHLLSESYVKLKREYEYRLHESLRIQSLFTQGNIR